MRKVIFHVDEIEKWPMNLLNIENLVAADENAEIRVLANGPAVKTYAEKQELVERIKDLHQKGVTFLACRNALNKFELAEDDILTLVEIVPAGVIELIDRQNDGFAYIRP